MTHEEKDKLLAEKEAELEQLRQMKAELEAKNAAAEAAAAEAAQKAAQAVAELESVKSAVDQKETAEPEAKPKKGKVRIELYKDENIRDDVQVFVNGRQYIIQRGVKVDVPREVFVVLQNQQRQKKHIIAYNDKHADKEDK